MKTEDPFGEYAAHMERKRQAMLTHLGYHRHTEECRWRKLADEGEIHPPGECTCEGEKGSLKTETL